MTDTNALEIIVRSMHANGATPEQIIARIDQEIVRLQHEVGVFFKDPPTDTVHKDGIQVLEMVASQGDAREYINSLARLLELRSEFGGNTKLLRGSMHLTSGEGVMTWQNTLPSELSDRRSYHWGEVVGGNMTYHGKITDLAYVLRRLECLSGQTAKVIGERLFATGRFTSANAQITKAELIRRIGTAHKDRKGTFTDQNELADELCQLIAGPSR